MITLNLKKTVEFKTGDSTFILKTLSKRKLMSLVDNTDNEKTLDILIESIIGWNNLSDTDGNKVDYDQNLVEDVVDALPIEVMNEMYKVLLGNNVVTETDRKN
jgi:hypothetical protein